MKWLPRHLQSYALDLSQNRENILLIRMCQCFEGHRFVSILYYIIHGLECARLAYCNTTHWRSVIVIVTRTDTGTFFYEHIYIVTNTRLI